jgi:hypothetical protein
MKDDVTTSSLKACAMASLPNHTRAATTTEERIASPQTLTAVGLKQSSVVICDTFLFQILMIW